MNNNYEITQEGLETLKKELEVLKSDRTAVIDTIKTAKGFGDLSENAEYSIARERQTMIEGRINEIEDKIKRAILVNNSKNKNVVGLGAKIEIAQVSNGNSTTKVIELVSSAESAPEMGKISQDSPLGKALLHKMVGDVASVQTPQKETKYRINKIM